MAGRSLSLLCEFLIIGILLALTKKLNLIINSIIISKQSRNSFPNAARKKADSINQKIDLTSNWSKITEPKVIVSVTYISSKG